MSATATAEKMSKPWRRLAATARVGVLILAIALTLWGQKIWHAWQVNELLAAADQPPTPVNFGPSWMRTKLGDEVVTWLNTQPTSLNFYRASRDEAWFHRLKAVPDLHGLSFEDVPIGDSILPNLEPLTQLDLLDFINCPKITDAALPQLSGFGGLRQLFLYGTAVTDAGMPALVKLRNLQSLSLQRTAVGDAGLAYVAQLPSIEKLFLGTPRIDDRSSPITERGLAELSRLPKLELLTLWDVELTDATVDSLRSLPHLARLWLDCPHATSDELSRLGVLTKLRHLDLADAALGDEIVDSLLDIPSLQSLNLDRTRITDAGLSRLAALPNLWELSLQGTEISAAGLAAFAGNRRLYQLLLDDTRIGDEAVDVLLAMPALTNLRLAGTRITDTGLMRLASHQMLNGLALSRTAIAAAGVKALLVGKPNLFWLDLDETSLTDDDLDALVTSRALTTSLAELSLKRTSVTQAGVTRLQDKLGGRPRVQWEPKP